MSIIGEYTSIHALNAGAIIDTLAAALYQARGTESYHLTQIETLTAENAAQAEEIRRLQDHVAELRGHIAALQPARTETPAHKYSVGDRVQAHGGLVGIIQAIDAAFSNFPYLVKWHGGEESWAGINSLSPAPSEAPDAALPAL